MSAITVPLVVQCDSEREDLFNGVSINGKIPCLTHKYSEFDSLYANYGRVVFNGLARLASTLQVWVQIPTLSFIGYKHNGCVPDFGMMTINLSNKDIWRPRFDSVIPHKGIWCNSSIIISRIIDVGAIPAIPILRRCDVTREHNSLKHCLSGFKFLHLHL